MGKATPKQGTVAPSTQMEKEICAEIVRTLEQIANATNGIIQVLERSNSGEERPEQEEWYDNLDVESQITNLMQAYDQVGWIDLREDLAGFQNDTADFDLLRAALRVQSFHLPMARVKTQPDNTNIAREIHRRIEALGTHCAAQCYYDNDISVEIEDTRLEEMISGLARMSEALQIPGLSDQLNQVPLAPTEASRARDSLRILILPACRNLLQEWCRKENVTIDLPTPTVVVDTPTHKKWDIKDEDNGFRVTDIKTKNVYDVKSLNCKNALRFLLKKKAFSQTSAVSKNDLCEAVYTARGRVGEKMPKERKPIQFFRERYEGRTRNMLFAAILAHDNHGMYWLEL